MIKEPNFPQGGDQEPSGPKKRKLEMEDKFCVVNEDGSVSVFPTEEARRKYLEDKRNNG